MKFSWLIFLFSFPFFLVAQNDCMIDICNNDECGFVFVTYTASGQNVFCEGGQVNLRNTSTTSDFEYFIVDWGDDTIDTIFNYDNVIHTYNFQGIDRCAEGPIFYQPFCYIGYKFCGNGYSCNYASGVVSVRLKPVAIFTVEDEICITELASFSNASCNATTYQWDFGDGKTSSEENPKHQYSVPGNYTVTLEATNQCGTDIMTRSISVIGLPEAEAEYVLDPSTGCIPLTVSFTNNSLRDNRGNQSVSWQFDPSLGWDFTDSIYTYNSWNNEVIFTTPNVYNVTLTLENICGEDSWMDSITVIERPTVNLSSIGSFCIDQGPVSLNLCDYTTYSGSIFGYSWTISDIDGNTVFTSSEECPTFTFDFPGNFQAIIQVDGGPCGNVEDKVNFSVQEPGSIEFRGIPRVICSQDSIFQIEVSPLGGTWTGSNAINQNSEFDPVAAGPGIHELVYTVGMGACSTTEIISIEVLETPTVQLDSIGPVCEQIDYSPQVTYTGEISTYSWSFQNGIPSSSNQANPTDILFNTNEPHQIIIEIDGQCGMAKDSFQLEVIKLDTININAPNLPICNTSSPFVLTATPTGGSWDGPGIMMDSIFDPSSVQAGATVDVTYTYGINNCNRSKDLSISVISSVPVIVDTGIVVCIDQSPITLSFSPMGGTWTGNGIIDASLGIFDPSVGVGFHTLDYTFQDQSGCIINKSTRVQVEDFPSVQTDSFASFCLTSSNIDLTAELNYTLNPSFGELTWFGPGIVDSNGLFNSSRNGANGLGIYTIVFRYELKDCYIIDSTKIEIIEAPLLNAGKDTVLCISNGLYQLTPSQPNGTWIGPGVNASSGLVDLQVAGGGVHDYKYTVFSGTTCEVNDYLTIEIIDFTGVDGGRDRILCEDSPPITLSNFSPTGGVWSGPGIIDSTNGIFDPRLVSSDSIYMLNYCVSSTEINCTACDQISMGVNPKPKALFEIVGTTCIGEEIEINNLSDLACNYTWSFGNGTISNEDNPRPVFNAVGDYTIQLIANSCENCKDTISMDIFVTEPPVADFTKDVSEGCAILNVDLNNNSFGSDIQYLWDFGNGMFDTIPEPNIINYEQGTKDTTYIIDLSVSNGCGTVHHIDSVTVFPLPLADYGTNVDDGCSPLEIEFANTTLGNPDTFYWYLDGVLISNDTIPSNQILTTEDSIISYYNITLVAANECGQDTFERRITVYPPNVQAFFHVDTTKGCQPLNIQFSNYSTPGATISWDFGDGNGSNIPNPIHTFDSAGIFTIYQYASNCGTDTDSVIIEVLPQPDVSFESEPYACLGQEIHFENTSLSIDGTLWNFGDGGSSLLNNPSHIFDSLGMHTVTLTGYSQINNCPASYSVEIEVIGPPEIGFIPSRIDGCVPLEITFQNISQGAKYYSWIFDDGNFTNEINPTHIFTEPGRYSVTLIGVDSFGCFTDSTLVNIIAHDLPVSNFHLNNDEFCSRIDSIISSNNSIDAVLSEWTFGNQINFTQNEPQLIWVDTGWVEVNLEVENQFGCRDTSQKFIFVKASPIAQAVADKTMGCMPLKVKFSNSSDYSNLSFWDFGDGNTRNETSPMHTYLKEGTYNTTFIAANTNKCPSDTAIIPIDVYPLPFSAFNTGDSIYCGLPVDLTFVNNSTGAVNYEWQIGSRSSTNFEPTFNFISEGEVFVQLIASTLNNCQDTSSRVLSFNHQPEALFFPEDLEICELENIQFSSLSSHADSWLWDFGDGEQSIEENPIHQYTDEGIYTIRLQVGSNNLCFDSLVVPNTINVVNGPVADFEWVDLGKGFIQFTNSSKDANFYSWNFNDGSPISNVFEPLHEFWDNNDWRVTLTTISVNGCENSITKVISPEFFYGLYVPNAFSPETGVGDVRLFKPKGKGIIDYQVQVFSPWGEQVWQSTAIEGEEPGEAWDGTYKGAILPQGAYVWKITVEFINGLKENRVGTVVLIR